MPRTCNCAGPCGPPEDDGEGATPDVAPPGFSRRGFLTILGTGVLVAGTADAGAEAPAAETLAAWKRNLTAPQPPRLYNSEAHGDARFPLGGIGTGGFEIGPDGRFTTWQLWNTLRDGQVPFCFGIRAGGTAKLLQTAGGPPGLPTVSRIEMTGEYPVASLAVRDPELPVEVTLTAFTPLIPLDSATSSLPIACFAFRAYNTGKIPQEVTLGAFLQNVIGYDAYGPVQSFNSYGFNAVPERWDNRHPNFGGNRNEAITEKDVRGVLFSASAGIPAVAARPFTVFTNLPADGLNAHPVDHAPGVRVRALNELLAEMTEVDARASVVWIENASTDLSAIALKNAAAAVGRGATLVWAGSESPLLAAIARTGTAPAASDVLFEDFENGYGRWKVEGEAFGTAPATGTLPNQQAVAGFLGKGMVNSFRNGDDTTGKLTSPTFTIERRYIRFLVGGGRHATTQVRLLVEGKIVRRQSGRDDERLEPAVWDVTEFRGKSAHIEIVDEQTGPWGHINADHFEFGDLPFLQEVGALLGGLLPARLAAGDAAVPLTQPALFAGATPLAGAITGTLSAGNEASLRFMRRTSGAGNTILMAGPLLAASNVELIGARQQAFAALAELLGVGYTPPQSVPAGAPGSGSMALAVASTPGVKITAPPTIGDWQTAWNAFAKGSTLSVPAATPTPAGQTINGAVTATVTLSPGQSVEIPFVLAWHFPNRFNDRNQPVGNHYATRWTDAGGVVREVVRNLPALRSRTEKFRSAFYESTLPYWMLDCVTSQISTIRHPGVVFQIGNGDIYGWEGSNGCCPPTCTHVWGYEQTLAYLFPDLEREMRRVDFQNQQGPDGGINNRTEIPSPPGKPTGERPFTDGHASCVLKFYREARNHADGASYLKAHWPRVRAAVDYLIARDAASSPDEKPDGTLSDDQWNTYDNAIHGVNTFIGTYYLAALRAGEEMARHTGDKEAASRYQDIFEKGQKNLVTRCWNGEYFEQHLPGYETRAGEYGPGCLSDQLIGQWWAHQLGLGYLLPKEHVQTALRSIFKYNWLTDHTNFRHNWRKFAGGKDKGLLICTWPKGGRPANTIPYVDEVWTGVEYQVAAHMAYEGMIEEALSVAKGARDRYDGVPRAPMPRNPWSEIECGGHYARAMSSWSLLLALSGFEYDGPKATLRFTPRTTPENFKAFFSAAEGWGSLRQTRKGNEQKVEMRVEQGKVSVRELHLSRNGNRTPQRVHIQVNGKAVRATLSPDAAQSNVRVLLDSHLSLTSGSALIVVTD